MLSENPIPDGELWEEKYRKVLNRFPQFANNAPQWFYILKEAEQTNEMNDCNGGGHHFGLVGGRIVAEVLVGLAYYDRHSFLQTARRRPHPAIAQNEGRLIRPG